MTPTDPDTFVLIDPDDPRQVDELATALGVGPLELGVQLRALRDRQRVRRTVDAYWRNNPEPRTRQSPR